jgi:hypothetical protein
VKYRKDVASATLVTGIISALFISLCAGLAIDVSKNVYLKESFTSRAQQSTQVAIKEMNSRGSLKVSAPAKLVTEYSGISSTSSYERDETKVWTGSCTTRSITSWDGKELTATMPYIVIRMDTQRALGTVSNVVWVSEGGGTPEIVSGTYDPTVKYSVIAADVHDSSANLMLSMFGMPCQDYDQKVSAISFGSVSDLQP